MKAGMPVFSADLHRTTPGALDAGMVALAHSRANQVVSAAVTAAIRSADEKLPRRPRAPHDTSRGAPGHRHDRGAARDLRDRGIFAVERSRLCLGSHNGGCRDRHRRPPAQPSHGVHRPFYHRNNGVGGRHRGVCCGVAGIPTGGSRAGLFGSPRHAKAVRRYRAPRAKRSFPEQEAESTGDGTRGGSSSPCCRR